MSIHSIELNNNRITRTKSIKKFWINCQQYQFVSIKEQSFTFLQTINQNEKESLKRELENAKQKINKLEKSQIYIEELKKERDQLAKALETITKV